MLLHCSPVVHLRCAAGGTPSAPGLLGTPLQLWRLISGLRQQCCPAVPAERPAHPALLPAAWQGQGLSNCTNPSLLAKNMANEAVHAVDSALLADTEMQKSWTTHGLTSSEKVDDAV